MREVYYIYGMNNIFSIIGLFLDIVGVVILFSYGLPSKIDNETPRRTISEEEQKTLLREKSNKKIKKIAKFALLLIILGFVFQLCSPIISIYNDKTTDNKPKCNNP